MANEKESVEITSEDLGQAEDILGSSVEEIVEEKIVLTHDWAPLKSKFVKLAGHAEAFIEEILEKIPNLTASRSKGQNVCLRFLGKAPVLRMWFNTRAITCNVITLEGKAAVELKENSFKMGANGFPKKTRKRILALARAYIKARGFEVPAEE